MRGRGKKKKKEEGEIDEDEKIAEEDLWSLIINLCTRMMEQKSTKR